MNQFFVVFRSFVLRLNSISKLIHNRWTCKLIIKTTAAYVHGHEQLRLRFYVLVRYFVVLDIHLLFISYSPHLYIHLLFASEDSEHL